MMKILWWKSGEKKRDQIHQTGYYKWRVHHKSDITRKGGGPILIISSVFLPQLKYNITTEMFCEDAIADSERALPEISMEPSRRPSFPAIYLCLPLFNTYVLHPSCLIFLSFFLLMYYF